MKPPTFAALLMLLAALSALALSAPADRPGLPLAGKGGVPGVGYCVSVQGSGVLVDVPYHAIGSAARKAQGLQPLEIAEFVASVTNAARLSANQSGDAVLIAAMNGKLAFPELGIPVTADATGECTCATSSCYGKPPTCVPTGCGGGCADCYVCKVTGGGATGQCAGRRCSE